MDSGRGHSRKETTLYSFGCEGLGLPVASLSSNAVAGTTSYLSFGSRLDRGVEAPHGCCQHRRIGFQWNPSSLSLWRTSFIGGAFDFPHTPFPHHLGRA